MSGLRARACSIDRNETTSTRTPYLRLDFLTADYTDIIDDIKYDIQSTIDPDYQQLNDMLSTGSSTFTIKQYQLNDRLIKECVNEPDEFIVAAKKAVLSLMKEIHPSYEAEIRDNIKIKIIEVEPIAIKEVLSEHINRLVAVEGKVIGIGDSEPVLLSTAYRCAHCSTLVPKKPKKCPNCSEVDFEFDHDSATYTDQQIIKIQELTSGGKAKQVNLSLVVEGKDMLWTVKAGEKVKATGIFRVIPYTDSKTHRVRHLKQLATLGIEKKDSTIQLTPEDIRKIKQMSEEPQIYEKLRDSFAPHLYGIEEVKEACILALASQGLDRPLNILLAGDPDTGKSEAMKYAVSLSHNGHAADMASTTYVGLTVESTYDDDTKTRLASPGMLNYADGGLAGIDELQAINPEDAKKLNGALEGKELESHKAGVHEKLSAKCAVIITANSEQGKWNTGENIYFNLRFLGKATAALVSRFDLIYILIDKKHTETDGKKANIIISTYGKTETPKDLFMEDTNDLFGFNTLQKYFAYITQHVKLPEVPDELTEKIKETWLAAREKDSNGVIGNRNLKSIIRLARIIARLLLKDKVDLADLTRARQLIDKSLDTSAFDPRAGEVDPNLAYGALKTSREVKEDMNQEESFLWAFDMALKEGEGETAKEQDIVAHLVITKKYDEDKARKLVHKRLQNSNAIPYFIQPKQGCWKKI